MKEVMKVRVMTRSFVVDIIARVKNALGGRISQYEDLLTKAKGEIFDELETEGIDLKWYRYEISQLTTGAMVIMLYGEAK